jgi:hypothetical protein
MEDEMTKMIQLDFFENKLDDIEVFRLEIEEIKKSSDKVRKGLYGSQNELKKLCNELNSRMDIIERYICRK